MDEVSPFKLAADINGRIAQFLSSVDVGSLPHDQRQTLATLKNQATDIRLEVRDYGMAETHAEQERIAKAIAERVEAAQATILKVSEYNLLGAADVAQLSAQLDQLKAVL